MSHPHVWMPHFAKWPVETLGGRLVFWMWIERKWVDNHHLEIIDPDDLGEYVGDWIYRMPLVLRA